jgi:di/tricarboxylate transporter
MDLTWQAWLTAGTIAAMVGVLAMGRFGADLVMMGAVLVLLLAGVIDTRDAVSGFASEGVITVAMLYIVATAMKETGAMHMVATRLIGRPRSVLQAQARLVLPVTGLSAFINNTPIVAMFLPALSGVARRGGFPASKLFMPLSFASILGGVCTLIGTSTNVVIGGLLRDAADAGTLPAGPDGQPLRFGMFTLSAVGIPIALVGTAYILLMGRRLLPDGRSAAPADDAAAEYFTALRVSPGSPIVNKTVEQAGLRHLPRLFLSRIDRGEDSLVPGSKSTIRAGDILVFVGALESVVDLQQIKGLEPLTHEEGPAHYRPNLRLMEAVVASDSEFVGRTIRGAGIRTKYGAAVVAVRRQGQRLGGKLGDIRLRAGDTLLLEAPKGFADRCSNSKDFYLASERDGSAALRHEKAWIALAILAALIVTLSFEWLSPLAASMTAAAAMILTRCCTGPQARSGIDWQVLIVIGAAFGLGRAMQATGLAETIAHAFVAGASPLGPWALLAAVYAVTVVFTAVMSNNAAAVLMFPIALGIAAGAQLNPMPFLVAITIAASCEFSTPIGYQTNLMVQGPGNYRWLDYLRFGGPLTILCGILCVALAPLAFGGFHPTP